MKVVKIVSVCLIFFISAASLFAVPLVDPQPVISSQKIAEVFHYQGELQMEDLHATTSDLQNIIFYAKDDSFYRVHIGIGEPGTIITKDFQHYFDLNPHDLEIVTLQDGTKAYISPLGVVMIKSSDGRFELRIDITPPGDNIEVVPNEKNKHMLGNESGATLRSLIVPIIEKIYPEVSKNFERLKREDKAFNGEYYKMTHPSSKPLSSSVSNDASLKPSPSPSPTPQSSDTFRNILNIPAAIFGFLAITGAAVFLFRRMRG